MSSEPNSERKTVSLKADVFKKLQNYQSKLIAKRKQVVSFSDTIDELLKTNL